jgi:hypothetical protein
MEDTFSITFVEGVDYHAYTIPELTSFELIIQNSFCLLSWLIPDYQIRIMDEVRVDQFSKVKIFTKNQLQEQYFIHERREAAGTFFYSLGACEKGMSKEDIKRKAIATAR